MDSAKVNIEQNQPWIVSYDYDIMTPGGGMVSRDAGDNGRTTGIPDLHTLTLRLTMSMPPDKLKRAVRMFLAQFAQTDPRELSQDVVAEMKDDTVG